MCDYAGAINFRIIIIIIIIIIIFIIKGAIYGLEYN